MDPNPTPPPFGSFSPTRSTLALRVLKTLGLGRGRVSRWMRRKWLENHGPAVDVTLGGIRYRLDIERNTTDGKILTSSKTYDAVELGELAACARQAAADPVFVDVGANTGYYSLTLASVFSKVVAIEANPPTQAMLAYNLALNHLENKVSLVARCVGSGGPVPFYCSGGLGSASLLPDSAATKPILVESAPLRELLLAAGLDHVDALKIDIEGYEDRALIPFFRDTPRSLWPRLIVIESCNRSVWETDVITHMRSLGYRETAQTRGNTLLRLSPGA